MEHGWAVALASLTLACGVFAAMLTGLCTSTARWVCALTLGIPLLLIQVPHLAAFMGLHPFHADDWAHIAGGMVVVSLLLGPPRLGSREAGTRREPRSTGAAPAFRRGFRWGRFDGERGGEGSGAVPRGCRDSGVKPACGGFNAPGAPLERRVLTAEVCMSSETGGSGTRARWSRPRSRFVASCRGGGSEAAEPVTLVRAMVEKGAHLADNEVVHLPTLGSALYVEPEQAGRFRHTAFFIGPNVRRAV